ITWGFSGLSMTQTHVDGVKESLVHLCRRRSLICSGLPSTLLNQLSLSMSQGSWGRLCEMIHTLSPRVPQLMLSCKCCSVKDGSRQHDDGCSTGSYRPATPLSRLSGTTVRKLV